MMSLHLTHAARHAKTNTYANSSDPDQTATLFAILSLIRRKPLFASVDKSKFKNGRVHFRKSGMNGLLYL